jgi:hypothetical protein
MPRFVERTIPRGVIEWNRPRQKLKCSSHAHHVDLRKRQIALRLLLRGGTFVHKVTKRTRMCAIKCLLERLAKRRALRVLDDHRCPGQRLERNPMQAHCAAKRENHDDAANAVKHAVDAICPSFLGQISFGTFRTWTASQS